MREPQPYRLRPEAVSLLDLPAEIRTDIYGYYMPQPITLGRRYEKPSKPYGIPIATDQLEVKETNGLLDMNLLRTSKQIRREASNVLHGCTASIRVSIHDLDLVMTHLGARVAEIESLTVHELASGICERMYDKTAGLVNATGLKKLVVQWGETVRPTPQDYEHTVSKFLGRALLTQLRMRTKHDLPWKTSDWIKEMVHLEGVDEETATKVIDHTYRWYLDKVVQMRLVVVARKEAKALAEAGQA